MIRRSELRRLAEMRLGDAHSLLNARRYPASYYIVGYAVECGLKACIARRFHANATPERQLVNSAHTHSLENLIGVAELTAEKDLYEAVADTRHGVFQWLRRHW